MERNFTRHTVANTLDNNSRGALLSKGVLTLTSSGANVQSKTQMKMPSLGVKLQLNQCSGKRLKDLESLGGGPVQILDNGQVKVEPIEKISMRKPLLKSQSKL